MLISEFAISFAYRVPAVDFCGQVIHNHLLINGFSLISDTRPAFHYFRGGVLRNCSGFRRRHWRNGV